MIHYINADLLESDCNFICHQVNCMGKMGSGIAKQIRARWPEVYENYSRVVDFDMFGKAQILYIEDANIPYQCVVNLFAQQTYGYDDNRYSETGEGKQIKYMWADIVENYTKEKDTKWYDLPSNIVGVLVDPISGKVATEETKNPTMFYYIKGTEPTYIDESLEALIPTMKAQ